MTLGDVLVQGFNSTSGRSGSGLGQGKHASITWFDRLLYVPSGHSLQVTLGTRNSPGPQVNDAHDLKKHAYIKHIDMHIPDNNDTVIFCGKKKKQ